VVAVERHLLSWWHRRLDQSANVGRIWQLLIPLKGATAAAAATQIIIESLLTVIFFRRKRGFHYVIIFSGPM
jgi:hypothetical protein